MICKSAVKVGVKNYLRVLIVLILLFCTKENFAQNDSCNNFEVELRDENDFLKLPSLLDSTNHKLGLRLYEHNFFKNNEFFGDYVKGYTLTGYHLQPEISYNPNKYFKFQALLNVLKYHGYDEFSECKPYFRIVFEPKPYLSVICGYIEGNVKHDLIEPIYNPERYYTNNMENGLQINLKSKRYTGELWLNWEKFILWGDPWQESLVVGHLSKFNIVDNPKVKTDILGSFLVRHRGGQIDDSDGEVQSLENGSIGIDYNRKGCENGVFRQLSLRAMLVQYHAIDETFDLPFGNGYGTYLKAHLRLWNFGFTAGHWYCHKFVNFRGDPLFTCKAIDPFKHRINRYVTFNELYYYKRYFNETLILKAGVSSWLDLANGNLEYSYMMSLAVNFRKFFL